MKQHKFMLLNRDSEYNIQQRQQGKDCLSWIENFGLHLFEKECKPKVSFKNGEMDDILVLRINKKEDTISSYYCSFKTDGKGYTRFCVNKAVDNYANDLKELMNKAKWEDKSNIDYWKEVFRDGKSDIDEDTLKRREVLAYADAEMVMIDFIGQIKKVFENVVSHLSIDNEKISKVFIVEQYAKALPVQYSLRKIFPNTKEKECVLGFLFKEWENRYSWFQKTDRFYIPKELLHAELNTSTRMTIGDIINLGENGIVITLPVEEKNGKYYLPSTPMIKGCNLKWSELIKGEIQHVFKAGNLLFKRVLLSMIADGFQTIYIKCDSVIVACSVYEKDVFNIMSAFQKISEESQKPTMSNTQQEQSEKDYEGGEVLQEKNEDERTIIDDSVDNVPKEDKFHESQDTNNTQRIPSYIDFEEKADKIVFRIHQGVKRTAKSLETIARDFLLKKYHKDIPQDASDSKKEVFWKKKYEESLSLTWQKTMLSNWKKHGRIEYSNFYSFLRVYQYKGLSWYLKASEFSIIDSSVAALKDIRNLNAHADNEEILGIGYTKILFSFEYMIKIAEQRKDNNLLNILEKYKSEIEKEWDDDFTNYLKCKYQ